MNTAIIVWVLMVPSPQFVSSLEFNSQQKCEAAIKTLTQQIREVNYFGPSNWFCAKIEK